MDVHDALGRKSLFPAAARLLEGVVETVERCRGEVLQRDRSDSGDAARVVTALPPEAELVYTQVGERSRELQEGGLDADWWVVAHENPAATIADHVRLAPSWLLTMATHGRTGLARVLMGSVTTEVVRRHTAPVLVIRPEHLGE